MATFETKKPGKIESPRGFTADPGDESGSLLVQSAGQVAQAGIGLYKQSKERALREEVEGEIETTGKVVSTINEAMSHSGKGAETFDPRTGDTLYIAGAPEEFNNRYAEVMNEAGDEFRSIASAVAQGATPKMAAAVQIEAKLKQLVGANPAFSDELRQVARSLTGYDPTGFHLRQILDITASGGSTKQTFAEKQREKAEYVAGILDIDVATVEKGMARELQIETSRKIAESEMKLGDLTAQAFITQDITKTGAYMDNFFVEQMGLIARGGVVNPEEQVAAMERAKAQHRRDLITNIQNATGGIGMSPEITKHLDSQLNAMYNPIIEGIKNNELGAILERKNKTLMQLDKQYGRRLWPRLTRMNNSLGERLTGTIIDQMASFANTEQFMLYAKQQPLLWEAIQGAQMEPVDVSNKALDVYEKVLTGTPLASDDVPWLKVVEPVVFDSKQDPEVRERYLKNLGSQDARGVGWMAQPGKRQIASEKDVAWMKREWQNTVPALVNKVADMMVEDPEISIKVTPDGKLQAVKKVQTTVKLKGVEHQTAGQEQPVHRKEVAQLQYFINAARNGWASDFGTTPEGALKDITTQITQTAENLEGTAEPSVMESVAAGAEEVLGNIQSAIKNYEDIVTGKTKPNDPNQQIKELMDTINKELERVKEKGKK